MQAVSWLQEQAQAQGWEKATKLSGRKTAQGLIGIHIEGQTGAMVEVNCETDFVARNEKFTSLVLEVARDFFVHGGGQGTPTQGVVKVRDVCVCDLISFSFFFFVSYGSVLLIIFH